MHCVLLFDHKLHQNISHFSIKLLNWQCRTAKKINKNRFCDVPASLYYVSSKRVVMFIHYYTFALKLNNKKCRMCKYSLIYYARKCLIAIDDSINSCLIFFKLLLRFVVVATINHNCVEKHLSMQCNRYKRLG